MTPANTARKDWAKKWMARKMNGFAGGKFLPADGTPFTPVNPANGEPLAVHIETSAAQVDLAVKSAHSAFQGSAWRGMSRAKRVECLRSIGAVIREHQAELATLETLANGKTYVESFDDDMPESADVFDYYSGWIDKLYGESSPVADGFINYTKREPIGVCALVVPWNFPLLLACWKIAPALAMGNTVVIKPAPQTSLTMIRLAELIQERAILPEGVFNVVIGGVIPGEALTRHPLVNKISFTGGTSTGRHVLKASAESNLKPVTLELGGKSPNIIFQDAGDLDAVAQRSFTAMFSHKGEKCSEPTRMIIHESIHDEMMSKLQKLAEAVRCGDPFSADTDQGAQCFEDHMKKILGYIDIGKKDGGRIVAGGHRDMTGTNAKGCFVRPTIITGVTSKMTIFQEEIFGPVLAVTTFKDEAEAVRLANDSRYGLAAGLYSKDIDRAMRVAGQLDSGQVFINRYGCYDFAAPFGGFKESGWGKEMAIHSLDSYTRVKSIWIKVAGLD
jgi:aldehyde dehydrogenase (NAD+)